MSYYYVGGCRQDEIYSAGAVCLYGRSKVQRRKIYGFHPGAALDIVGRGIKTSGDNRIVADLLAMSITVNQGYWCVRVGCACPGLALGGWLGRGRVVAAKQRLYVSCTYESGCRSIRSITA